MVRLTQAQEVRAPRERVFQYLTEVERFPALFPDIFSKMQVIGGEGRVRILSCEEKWAGRAFNYTMKEELSPPDGIVRTIIQGSGKGTEVSIALLPSAGGTRVAMTVKTKRLFASLCGGVARGEFEREVQRVFEGYLKLAEASAVGASEPLLHGVSVRNLSEQRRFAA